MLHLCEEAIAALHRPWCCNLHGMVYSADKPFNNSFLLIVVEVNRSQIMTSHGIHSCQDITSSSHF